MQITFRGMFRGMEAGKSGRIGAVFRKGRSTASKTLKKLGRHAGACFDGRFG